MVITDWFVLLYLITKHGHDIKDQEQVLRIKNYIQETIDHVHN